MANIEHKVVSDFGTQWNTFDQSEISPRDLQEMFNSYFAIFPWNDLPVNSIGFDLGCGSGRWARLAAPRVGSLYCIDPSSAIQTAKMNLRSHPNCRLIQASVEALPLADNSLDFGYALGVLHHVVDTQAAIQACVSKLKPQAPLLLYLYYAFDNKPLWFRSIWRVAETMRRTICILPTAVRYCVTQLIAALLYYPLARTALVLERLGIDVSNFPLSQYRNRTLYVMRTDAYDRFATRFEQRFTRKQIAEMLEACGLEKILFSTAAPYWCVVARKRER